MLSRFGRGVNNKMCELFEVINTNYFSYQFNNINTAFKTSSSK